MKKQKEYYAKNRLLSRYGFIECLRTIKWSFISTFTFVQRNFFSVITYDKYIFEPFHFTKLLNPFFYLKVVYVILFNILAVAYLILFVPISFIFIFILSFFHLLGITILFLISRLLYYPVKVSYLISKLSNKISYTCPNCQKKFKDVVYYCPKCGAPHYHLYPNQYGFFIHKCTCGEKLPTLYTFKKNLTAACPSCGTIVHNGINHSSIFPVFGGRSCGKTCFINSALTELENLAPKINFEYSYFYQDVGDEREKFKQYMNQGYLPESTHDDNLVFYNFLFSPSKAKVKNHISLCDISGEVFQNRDTVAKQKGYKYADSIFFIIDPLQIADFRDEAVEEGYDIAEFKISPSNITDIVSSMVLSLKEIYRKKKQNLNLIVVFSKGDHPKVKQYFSKEKIDEVIASQNLKDKFQAMDYLGKNLLKQYNENNSLQILENYFKILHFFTCSSTGDELITKKKINSYGASEPLLYAMCNAYANMDYKKVGLK